MSFSAKTPPLERVSSRYMLSGEAKDWNVSVAWEEREKKKSVMEQLKSQPKAEHKKTAPKKSAEREI